jgi:hypothetical protein
MEQSIHSGKYLFIIPLSRFVACGGLNLFLAFALGQFLSTPRPRRHPTHKASFHFCDWFLLWICIICSSLRLTVLDTHIERATKRERESDRERDREKDSVAVSNKCVTIQILHQTDLRCCRLGEYFLFLEGGFSRSRFCIFFDFR